MSLERIREWMEQYRPQRGKYRFAHPVCRTCRYPAKYTACVPVPVERRQADRRVTA